MGTASGIFVLSQLLDVISTATLPLAEPMEPNETAGRVVPIAGVLVKIVLSCGNEIVHGRGSRSVGRCCWPCKGSLGAWLGTGSLLVRTVFEIAASCGR